jgi:SAM-dependent methyltransferase
MSPRRPNGSTTRQLYDEWHRQLNVDEGADAPWHQLVRSHVDPDHDLRDKRILEIGCGRGGFSCWLAAQPLAPREVVAMDFSPIAVEKGRSFAAEHRVRNITWMTGDIEAIPYPEGSFDTVVSCETIEHVPHPPQAVRELARVLRPGGRLFLSTPNYLGLMGLYRLYLRVRGERYTEVGQPINNLTFLPVTAFLVTRAGLHIRTLDGFGHYIPYPGRPPIRLTFLDSARFATRWFGLQSLVVAEKPIDASR